MTSKRDDYDVFLDTWEPSPTLKHATLSSNLNDPVARQRLINDSTGAAALKRTAYAPGMKAMSDNEADLRGIEFFKNKQTEWSKHFCDLAQCHGVASEKIDSFMQHFATLWVDGKSRRQDSEDMMAIKASIWDHDQKYHPKYADKFVWEEIDKSITPMFTPVEMKAVFEANESLIEMFMSDYMEHLGSDGPTSINDLYVRRGVHMPKKGDIRIELHYLSSYSFAVGPVEQFAQTWTTKTKDKGVPSIFSAPLPAIQKRVVAFAPFIKDMDLSQMELVVAPPIECTPLKCQGDHGGILEFEFR